MTPASPIPCYPRIIKSIVHFTDPIGLLYSSVTQTGYRLALQGVCAPFVDGAAPGEGEEHSHYGRNKHCVTKDVNASETLLPELVTFIIETKKKKKRKIKTAILSIRLAHCSADRHSLLFTSSNQ